MRLDRFIAKSRIIDLKSKDLEGALKELVRVSYKRAHYIPDEEKIIEELLERESTMTTYLGNGIVMPHVRTEQSKPYVFAVGRCKDGLHHDGQEEYENVRLVFLLLASVKESNYLNVLASLARMFKEKSVVDHIISAPTVKGLRERIYESFGGLLAKPQAKQIRLNRLLFKQAERIAKSTKAAAIVLFSDTFAGGIEITDGFPSYRMVVVSHSASDRDYTNSNIDATIEVRAFSQQRLAQMRSAVLIGLTRGIFKTTDRICCVGGIPSSNQLDTMVIVDIAREFHSVIHNGRDLLPAGVKDEVVERMLGIATELAVEGREGKPVGCMFVLGDTEHVNHLIKPLVLNPFHGYKEEDRNVLNPFMDETIKEFSVIDGCFVIRGDGVVESAGSLIHAPSEFYEDMPSGFGSRHSNGAAISKATNCLSIVVSASSGQISIFRRGVMLPLLDKSVGSTASL